MQNKIADFSKLPFMLKSIRDSLNSTMESDTCLCITAERAITNLKTEHGIAIKVVGNQQYGNHLLCQFNSFEYKQVFPTLIQ